MKSTNKTKYKFQAEDFAFIFPSSETENHSTVPYNEMRKRIETAYILFHADGSRNIKPADISGTVFMSEANVSKYYSRSIFETTIISDLYKNDYDDEMKTFEDRVLNSMVIRFLDNFVYRNRLNLLYPDRWFDFIDRLAHENFEMFNAIDSILGKEAKDHFIEIISNYLQYFAANGRYMKMLIANCNIPEVINSFHSLALRELVKEWINNDCSYDLTRDAIECFDDLMMASQSLFLKYSDRIKSGTSTMDVAINKRQIEKCCRMMHKIYTMDYSMDETISSLLKKGNDEIKAKSGSIKYLDPADFMGNSSTIKYTETMKNAEYHAFLLCEKESPKNISQFKLAEASGITRQTLINNYGEKAFRETAISKAAQEFNLPSSESIVYNVFDIGLERYIESLIHKNSLSIEMPGDWIAIFDNIHCSLEGPLGFESRTEDDDDFVDRRLHLFAAYMIYLGSHNTPESSYLNSIINRANSKNFIIMLHYQLLYLFLKTWLLNRDKYLNLNKFLTGALMDINTIITLDCYIIGSEASSIIAKKVLADPKRKAEKEKLILEILSMFDENEPD